MKSDSFKKRKSKSFIIRKSKRKKTRSKRKSTRKQINSKRKYIRIKKSMDSGKGDKVVDHFEKFTKLLKCDNVDEIKEELNEKIGPTIAFFWEFFEITLPYDIEKFFNKEIVNKKKIKNLFQLLLASLCYKTVNCLMSKHEDIVKKSIKSLDNRNIKTHYYINEFNWDLNDEEVFKIASKLFKYVDEHDKKLLYTYIFRSEAMKYGAANKKNINDAKSSLSENKILQILRTDLKVETIEDVNNIHDYVENKIKEKEAEKKRQIEVDREREEEERRKEKEATKRKIEEAEAEALRNANELIKAEEAEEAKKAKAKKEKEAAAKRKKEEAAKRKKEEAAKRKIEEAEALRNANELIKAEEAKKEKEAAAKRKIKEAEEAKAKEKKEKEAAVKRKIEEERKIEAEIKIAEKYEKVKKEYEKAKNEKAKNEKAKKEYKKAKNEYEKVKKEYFEILGIKEDPIFGNSSILLPLNNNLEI